MLNRDEYRKFINPAQPLVNTGAYATIERAAGPAAWRAVCVYHLPGEINNRQLIAFCDILDSNGDWADDQGLEIAYTWQGRNIAAPLVRPFEKRPPEPRAQVDLYKHQVTTIWVDDPFFPSDRVVGLHSAVEDGQGGNTLFHNSFVVLWQLLTDNAVERPVEMKKPDAGNLQALLAENAALRDEVALLRSVVADVAVRIGSVAVLAPGKNK